MIRWIGNIEAHASEYMRDELAGGLSLSHLVASRLPSLRLHFYAVVRGHDRPSAERIHRFTEGGIGGGIVDAELALDLARRFRAGELIVEISLARPTDQFFDSLSGDKFVFDNDEVYAHCSLMSEIDEVERTLREADPAYGYNAFVFLRKEPASTLFSPADEFARGVMDLRAIIVGAYDGEGLVVAVTDPSN